jgi:E3 ubiquitin-protein ligase TRIP12
MPVHDLMLAGPSGSARGSEAPAGAGADSSAAGAAASTAAALPRASSAGAAAQGAQQGQAQQPGRSAWQGGGGSGQSAAQMLQAQEPRLQFYLGDQPLAASTTVFQAIHMQQQQQAAAAAAAAAGDEPEPGAGRGRHMWEGLYTLRYRLAASAASDAAAAAAAASSEAAAGGGAAARPAPAGDWAASPLAELLTAALPRELSAPESCRQVLQLLQLLEALNRLGPRLAASLALQEPASQPQQPAQQQQQQQQPHGRVAREDLVSSKLGSKLAQQLKDVLSICGGTLPAWCRHLIYTCKFLFPFEVRRRYFYCTALGMGRALQHVQQQQTSEGGGGPAADAANAPRVGRLSRQKVRAGGGGAGAAAACCPPAC